MVGDIGVITELNKLSSRVKVKGGMDIGNWNLYTEIELYNEELITVFIKDKIWNVLFLILFYLFSP